MLVTSSVVALLLAAGSASAAAIEKGRYETVVKEDPDFGLCVPTMKYEGGLGGRPAAEFTFQPIDPLCTRGQPEALNPSKLPIFQLHPSLFADSIPRHHYQSDLRSACVGLWRKRSRKVLVP